MINLVPSYRRSGSAGEDKGREIGDAVEILEIGWDLGSQLGSNLPGEYLRLHEGGRDGWNFLNVESEGGKGFELGG